MSDPNWKQLVKDLIQQLPYCIEWVPGEEPTRVYEIGAGGEKIPLKFCGKPATRTEAITASYCDKHSRGVDAEYAKPLRALIEAINEEESNEQR